MNMKHTAVDQALDGWLQRVNELCGRFCAKALGEEFAGRIEQYQGGALRMSFNRETLAALHDARGCEAPVLTTTSWPSAA